MACFSWTYKYGQFENEEKDKIYYSKLINTNNGEVHELLEDEPNIKNIKDRELPPDIEMLNLSREENQWLINLWLDELRETWATNWFQGDDKIINLMLAGKGILISYIDMLEELKKLIPEDWWKNGVFIRFSKPKRF